MQWGAHVVVALGATSIALGEVSRLALCGATSITGGLFFAGGIVSAHVGAVLPDIIDFTFARAGARHRNRVTHGLPSLIIPFFIVILGYCLFHACLPACLLTAGGIAIGLPLGWVSHLLLDALTPHGIPLPSGQFSWNWAPYDSPAGNCVLKVVGGIYVVTGFLLGIDPVYPLFFPLLGALWACRWRSDRVRESDTCVQVLTKENAEVVATLTAIAAIHERMQDQGRAIAYRNAARTFRDLRWSVKKNYTRIHLEDLPFVGNKIAGVVRNLLLHGHSDYLQWLGRTEKAGMIRAKYPTRTNRVINAMSSTFAV